MRTVRKLVAGLAAVAAGLAATAAPAQPVASAAMSSPPTAAAAPSLTRPDVEAWLDGMLPYALKRGDVAGAVVAVVKDGRPLLVKGYGYADVATRKQVSPDQTLFRPGSVTKLFTWTAVMQLVGEGKIDLDRDVNAYLDFRIPARAGGPVTMRRLMTHSAGFEETIGNLASRDAKDVRPLGATLKRWTPARIYPAGSTPAYSNYGAALAGYIVQRVSGQLFDDYVEQHIFQPLGMDHSTMRQPPPEALRALMSRGYRTASEPPKPYEFIGVPPAGSAASSGADMARFMIAQLQDEHGAGLLLKPETARLMHRTYAPGLGPLNRMTLGFLESNLNGRRIISHPGDTQWFHSELDLFLDDGVGLYFSANSAGKDAAAQQIRTELLQAFADRYFPGPQPQGSVDQATARSHAAMIAGVYESSRRSASNFMSLATLLGAMPVKANPDGTISTPHILALDGQPRTWREIAPFIWKDTAGPWRIAAQVRDGRVVRFSTDQFSPIMVFEPAPWWRSGAWLAPALQAGLAALALTALLWPVAALARRRYRAPFALEGRDAWAYRGARLACIASVAVAAGWMAIISAGIQDLTMFSGPLNPWIMALGLAGPVAMAAGLAVTLWNAWRVWRRTHGRSAWFARLWSVVLVLGVATVCWTVAAFHLFGPNAHF